MPLQRTMAALELGKSFVNAVTPLHYAYDDFGVEATTDEIVISVIFSPKVKLAMAMLQICDLADEISEAIGAEIYNEALLYKARHFERYDE